MKDFETLKPLIIKSASGSYLELNDGRKIIDAISSWWCKSLGHNHPRLKKALISQLDQFEHVILSNTTHETLVLFSETLTAYTKPLNKILFASDGSSAIEIAMKMSLHTRKILGQTTRTKFMSLSNSFHGETLGALSISDVGLYRNPYQEILFDPLLVSPLPYVSGREDPLWNDCENEWLAVEKKLEPFAHTITALVIEPILQAAGFMKIYSQDFLKRLVTWAKKNHIHIINDEIMTGLGRTGKMLASDHAGITPDFLCLGKGVTAGFLPMSVTLTNDAIYDLFYADYAENKNFLHSHTQSGNALGVRVALEVLNILKEENICKKAEELEKTMIKSMTNIAVKTKLLKNIRGIGGVIAADLICDSNRRMGFEVFQKSIKLGAFLRPLGNTIYWTPPLNISSETLLELENITEKAIVQASDSL